MTVEPTAPVTGDLLDQIVTDLRESLRQWSAMGIEGTRGVQQEDFLAASVVARLVSLADPGDLPERMAEAIGEALNQWSRPDAKETRGTRRWDFLAAAAMSVRWETAIQAMAAADEANRRERYAVAEHRVTQERLAEARRELAQYRARLAARITEPRRRPMAENELLEKYRETVSVLLGQRDALNAEVAELKAAEPTPCPVDHQCEGEQSCGCWCELHDVPIAECPTFKLVDSWMGRLRAERDAANATITRVREALASFDGRGVNNFDVPTPGEVLDAWRAALDASGGTETEKPISPSSDLQRFAADVARLVRDYSNEERGVIALTPFEATLDQLCLEKYGFDLDKVIASAGTESTEDGGE